ncbi:hypothetical protein AWJ20_4152 [Sugiyamaella lignohabitans]|uniref:ER membrane protein complex subunit 7 beta-sandwich domain-containing protein n=1 Tax=Sugiyamaella lignohabitans TaxID=796027 RepID=A0A167C8A6_9ASCO|nr:uncharacterized protein AWJ20_4152 [Sugiyamaella lignohabitans]ANB11346.1 hypothetical protein AWJ20_4152 [Sugiyamaella lignohabitans]
MNRIILSAIVLIFSLLSVHGYTLRGSIAGAPTANLFPLTASDITSTKIILRNRDTLSVSEAYLQSAKGDFTFNNVVEGSYILSLQSLPLITPYSYRVDIRPGEVEVHQVVAGHDINTDLGPRVSYPIVIDQISRPKYTVEREAFSLINMVKSPMMLMSLGSLVMVFLLPKMAANIDPETVQQLQDTQKSRNEVVDKVSNFDMASYLAGKSQ